MSLPFQVMYISAQFPSVSFFFLKPAYSAYTYAEMAAALRLAFPEIKFVSILNSFANFRDSVDEYLNDASKTPGPLFDKIIQLHLQPAD